MGTYILVLYSVDGDEYEYGIINASSKDEAYQKANDAGYKTRFKIISPDEIEFIK